MIRPSIFLAAGALLFGGACQAAGARAQLDAFGRDLNTLSGRFEQTSSTPRGGSETSSGTLALAAPRLFRWDYEAPFEQRIVADGDHVWVWDIDLEQVSVRPQSLDEASSPLAVLMDLKQLDVDFKVAEAGSAEGLDWLRLQSRSKEPQFEQAELGFSGNALRAMRVADNFGGQTRYVFSDWRRNGSLPADHFRFQPPEGVDVIGQQREGAQIQPIQD